jgi:hypothetical protein
MTTFCLMLQLDAVCFDVIVSQHECCDSWYGFDAQNVQR